MTRNTRANAAKAGVKPFWSKEAERMETIVQLADVDGVSLEGARVRIMAWSQLPLADITMTFEVLDGDRWVCISRIDFLPPGPHPNVHWKQFNLEPSINGSHIHTCKDNGRLGLDAFTPRRNLPNAVPLSEEPLSFRDMLAVAANFYNIDGLGDITPPEWNESLSW
ncbi:hypothetical protein [Mesorhizobium sp.]|uniref:hypothetical protein n=1 Tax=Mesorhizobium sp. TaxID=1871066 RepID=UPI000FE47032|nr:hypothetical protein [Mesorhizobium sp.]RWM26879.1 MAG: hypothetical protein EOR74_13815 [Mesorhizobium sp.]RWM36248.1 MAG: hypothetical protein EOR75_22415 [Mesorhizobium sp.]TJV50163.1 MAG: hypothetical protein E5Y01_20460 [Mesorhizobium sp.]